MTGWRRHPDARGYAFVTLGLALFLAYEEVFQHLPFGQVMLGVAYGAIYSLPALALVLIYRTNRVVNFAQGDLGGFSAALAAELILVFHWPWWLGFLTAVGAAGLMSALIELSVVRYFFNSPRLILTVATIGVSQVLAVIQLLTPKIFEHFFHRGLGLTYTFPEPFETNLNIGFVHLGGSAVMALIGAPLIGLAILALLRLTMLGAAIRASSEDLSRARSLGIPAKRLSTLVWLIAGLISGVASVLSIRVQGFEFGTLVGPGFLLRSIAPAVIGRFESLVLTAYASFALGIIDQAVLFNTAKSGPTQVVLFVVIVLALVFQRRIGGRAALTESSTWQLLREVRPIPRRLAGLPEVRLMRRGAPLVALAALCVVPFVVRVDQVSLADVILVYAMVGISLVVLSGWGGQLSFGQWAIAGIGAFTAAQVYGSTLHLPLGATLHVDFILTLAVAATAGACVSVLIGLPALRVGGYFLAVGTLAFAIAADAHLFSLFRPTGEIARPMLFRVVNGWDERSFYFVVLAGFLLTWFLATNFRRSRLGRTLVAMRDNDVAGAALGFGTVGIKVTAFVFSGFVAAFAGALYAFTERHIKADGSFPAYTSLSLFAIVVFGGLGSPAGAALGAAVVFGIGYFVGGDYALLATGAGILLMLVAAPGGIGQLVYDARDAVLRAIARRHGLDAPAAPAPAGAEVSARA